MTSATLLDAPASLPSTRRPIMVLLVDDQLVIGEAVRRALIDQSDVEFHYCSNPTEALKLARRIRPTVILQDLVMPEVSGLDLVRQYRSDPLTRNIPIIVLSTKEEAVVKRDAFVTGANDYLVKLPDPIELVARIRYHSVAYSAQVQRDEAYRALRQSQQELMETNLELQRLTNLDGLTGLSNRRYLNDYMEIIWKDATRMRSSVSVLMIDIDHFKLYNDSYGHLAGDDVLQTVGSAIKQACKRPADIAARFGGEEFMIVLPSLAPENLREIAEALTRSVEELHLPHNASTTSQWVTISAGGASMSPTRGQPFSELIEAADKALYEAKKAGRNRAVIS